MKKSSLYILLALVAVAVIALVITGSGRKKKLDERLTFRKQDKIPYGTWVTYQSLPEFFPGARLYSSKREPGLWDEISEDSTNQLYMVVTPRFMPEEYEMRKLIAFAENGNDVFISTREVSSDLESLLGCAVHDADLPFYFDAQNTQLARMDDSLSLTLRQPWFQTGKRFNYPGRKLDAVFTKLDATITDELGNDGEGNTNFVHLQAGKGHIYLHLAPLAFSNYFLLRGNNMEYFEQVMSVVQPGVRKIIWDEYFINKKNQENNRSKKSWLTVLSRYPGLKAALLTAIFTLLLYLLLEMRRKQRFIPVVTKPRNDSLDFVKTIGRLYYDRSDHQNLCRKMATYFLEHIRSRYKLPTGNLDETFIRNLQFKTGVEEQEIRGIVTFIRYIEDAPAVAAADVHAFHQQLESFYKKA